MTYDWARVLKFDNLDDDWLVNDDGVVELIGCDVEGGESVNDVDVCWMWFKP